MKKAKEFLEDLKPVLEIVGPPAFGLILLAAVMVILILTGCASTANKVTASASGKNLTLDGFVTLGEVEMNNPETGTPEGKMIIGRLSYKSRKVGIPTDQRVPTTGYFKRTKTKSFFGTEEEITEFDFTAGSDAEAAKAMEVMKGMREERGERKDAAAQAGGNGQDRQDGQTAAHGENGIK